MSIREVPVPPVSVTYTGLEMVEVVIRTGRLEDGTTFDQVTAFWDVPQPGGGMHRLSVKLAKAESDLFDAAPRLGREILDGIRDLTTARAQAVFNELWGL